MIRTPAPPSLNANANAIGMARVKPSISIETKGPSDERDQTENPIHIDV